MMLKITFLFWYLTFSFSANGEPRAPLSYVTEPNGLYSPQKPDGASTLLDLITSRPELSKLASTLEQPAGFSKAFDTTPTWNFTFFAPSNEAFNNTGDYFETYLSTPKGIWWIGNVINHHYIPNSILRQEDFNSTLSRVQTGSYLYIGTQLVDDVLILNGVARVTEADIPLTNGVVHIVDRILDPSAQMFEMDLAKVKQKFIAGSCSNPDLPYC
ncbi:FAS1 domain-containing protein [Macrophomina phaseolina]|uniref:FAS1 domain-containing protein n=1 Tax=Macrophomina phaseolina TaxID=35725 RepID=A0ABQ8GFV9_9PEZI|nr:FAS1 domain-containing protein [Macrophomina phaseolina]